MKALLLSMMILFATGCSNRAVYESMQLHEKNRCFKAPPSEYRECREAATSKSYDEYKREYNSAK